MVGRAEVGQRQCAILVAFAITFAPSKQCVLVLSMTAPFLQKKAVELERNSTARTPVKFRKSPPFGPLWKLFRNPPRRACLRAVAVLARADRSGRALGQEERPRPPATNQARRRHPDGARPRSGARAAPASRPSKSGGKASQTQRAPRRRPPDAPPPRCRRPKDAPATT